MNEEVKKEIIAMMMRDKNTISNLQFGYCTDDLKKYIQLGGDINEIFDDRSLLHYALAYGHLYKTKIILSHPDIDVNKTDKYKDSALHNCLSNIMDDGFFKKLHCFKLAEEAGAKIIAYKYIDNSESLSFDIERLEKKLASFSEFVEIVKKLDEEDK